MHQQLPGGGPVDQLRPARGGARPGRLVRRGGSLPSPLQGNLLMPGGHLLDIYYYADIVTFAFIMCKGYIQNRYSKLSRWTEYSVCCVAYDWNIAHTCYLLLY